MITLWDRRYSLMILFAITLHYMWVIGLLFDWRGINTTGLKIFLRLFPTSPGFSAILLFIVASMALISLARSVDQWTVPLMLPQQATLMISAYGALEAITTGTFGDGVQRPTAFILNDQGWAILAAVFHTLAIVGRTSEL